MAGREFISPSWVSIGNDSPAALLPCLARDRAYGNENCPGPGRTGDLKFLELRLAQLHGGAVDVVGPGPGQDNSFEVRLPLHSEQLNG